MKSTADHYNEMIDSIENKLAYEEKINIKAIADQISKETGRSLADLTIIMTYLSGISLRDYIKDRALMKAYSELIAMNKFDVQKVIDRSGYGDQSAFTKAFTKRFEISPQKAFKAKNPDLLLEKYTWDKIEKGDYKSNMNTTATEEPLVKIFGLSQEKYKELSKIYDLKIFYGLNDMLANMAYEYANSRKINLEQAFEYIAEFGFHKRKRVEDQSDEEYQEALLSHIYDKENEYGYFYLKLSVDVTIDTADRLEEAGEKKLNEIEPNLALLIAHSPDMAVSYCKQVYNFYKRENGDFCSETYDKYIEMIWAGWPMQDAIEEAIIQSDIDAAIDELSERGEPYKYRKAEKLQEKEDMMFGFEPDWFEEETDYKSNEDTDYYNEYF